MAQSIIKLTDMKKYYQGLEHQIDAVTFLGNLLLETPAKDRLKLRAATDWVQCSDNELIWLQKQISRSTLDHTAKIWRQANEPIIDASKAEEKLIKELPMFTQLDNPVKPHVSCNSSSHAMMGASIKPEAFPNDSQYVREVYAGKYGRGNTRNPSIYWDVHVRGLSAYGIKIRVNGSGNFNKALAQADRGILTPINIEHRGPIGNPRGGHVICLAGSVKGSPHRVKIHDPYGELDYINGVSNLQKSGIYTVSKKNLLKRWQGIFSEYLSHS